MTQDTTKTNQVKVDDKAKKPVTTAEEVKPVQEKKHEHGHDGCCGGGCGCC